ncbi:MAG: hypothetical protein H6839_08715 [Planctomycetes bacterium]|nr:hypothetical protein [Planctomycetota bacterium]
MHTETHAGLDTSKAFLRDAVELSQLLMQRALEAARRGEDVDWDSVREIVREGRTSARQLAQIASLEVRDRALDLRERKETQKAEKPRPKPASIPLDRQSELEVYKTQRRYIELKGEWMQHFCNDPNASDENPGFPHELVAMMKQYGIEETNVDAIDRLSEIVFPEVAEVS